MDKIEIIMDKLNHSNFKYYDTALKRFVNAIHPWSKNEVGRYIKIEDYIEWLYKIKEYQNDILFKLNTPRKRVAVYSGSFNPFHKGHKAIVDQLSREFSIVDVVVSPKNPLKDDNLYKCDFWQRLKSVEESCSDLEFSHRVFVDRIEHGLEPPYYYINTLKELDWEFDEYEVIPVFGADCLETFDKWYEWKEILKDREVCIIPRKGYDGEKLLEDLKNKYPEDSKKWNIRFLRYDIPKISSTEIRNSEK